MRNLILPKTFCPILLNSFPFFFLAGPVLGGDDWQQECFLQLKNRLDQFKVAIPIRYHGGHPLLKYVMKGDDKEFDRQLPWERRYLEIAARSGCILFWLPRESLVNPRSDGKPYATETRGELGEWRGRLMYRRNLRIVVGGEEGFPGLKNIQRNFSYALDTDFPIYSTLGETIIAAIQKSLQ